MSEKLARKFHEAYERLAPSYGYSTRKETRDFDPKSPNGELMIRVCGEVCGEQQAENERLRQLVGEAFFEGFSDGVTAGHPMGSRSSDSEAWENSNSKSEVNNE